MTDAVGSEATAEVTPSPTPRTPKARAKAKKGPVAPASRVLTAGLSIGAACAIITALAMSQPTQADTVQLDVTSSADTAPTTSTTAAPPPTTIVINKIYVPVPAGGDPAAVQSSSGSRRSSGGSTSSGSGSSGGATASSGASSSPAPAAAPAPAPTPTTAAPVARTKAS